MRRGLSVGKKNLAERRILKGENRALLGECLGLDETLSKPYQPFVERKLMLPCPPASLFPVP